MVLSLVLNFGHSGAKLPMHVLTLPEQDVDPDPWTGGIKHFLTVTDAVHGYGMTGPP